MTNQEIILTEEEIREVISRLDPNVDPAEKHIRAIKDYF